LLGIIVIKIKTYTMKETEFIKKLTQAKELCTNVSDANIRNTFMTKPEKAIFEIAQQCYKGRTLSIDKELAKLAMNIFPWATHNKEFLSYETRKVYYYTSVYILQEAEQARINGAKGLTLERIYYLIKKYKATYKVLSVLMDHNALFLEDGLYKRSQVEEFNFRSIASFYNLDIKTKPRKEKKRQLLITEEVIVNATIDLQNPNSNTLNLLRIEYVKRKHPNFNVQICGSQTSVESEKYNPQFAAVQTSPNTITIYPHIHNYPGYKGTLGKRNSYLCNDYLLGISEATLAILVKLNCGQDL